MKINRRERSWNKKSTGALFLPYDSSPYTLCTNINGTVEITHLILSIWCLLLFLDAEKLPNTVYGVWDAKNHCESPISNLEFNGSAVIQVLSQKPFAKNLNCRRVHENTEYTWNVTIITRNLTGWSPQPWHIALSFIPVQHEKQLYWRNLLATECWWCGMLPITMPIIGNSQTQWKSFIKRA